MVDMVKWLWGIVLVCALSGAGVARPTASELCREGRKLVEQGDVRGGTEKYNAALKLDSHCAEAHAGLGQLFARMSLQLKERGDEAEAKKFCKVAIQALGTAIRNKSKDPMAYFWRGECYFASHSYTEALKDYDRSIALNPRWETHMARAVCHSRLDREEQAVADYTVVYRATHDSICLYNRGNCYRRLQRREPAVADYRTVVRECKKKEVVVWASRELQSMGQDREFRHPDTRLLFPGSFGFHGQTFERDEPRLMKGGSPKEWMMGHTFSGNAKITTYVFPQRRSFQEEWADCQSAIEQLPNREVRKVVERQLKLVGWGQAREASYRVPPFDEQNFTEVVLLSFAGHHVKIRITCDQNTAPLAKRYLGLIQIP